jgi:DNA-directed RNA polymerase specialized sigma24 family protein
MRGLRDDGRRNDDDRDDGRGDPVRALMLGYCRGERDAFDRLYVRIAPSILARLVAWTGDRPRAEVLLDQTFQVLHACRASYVEGADPEPWVLQIARREYVLDCRRRAAHGRRRFWSSVRAMFTRTPSVEVEARS